MAASATVPRTANELGGQVIPGSQHAAHNISITDGMKFIHCRIVSDLKVKIMILN